MATDSRPLKGILKKPAGAAPGQDARRQDPREIALQHARIIQQRKDLEVEILESLALLSEYPTERVGIDDSDKISNTGGNARRRYYSAADPSPRDAAAFKSHVRLFQPSDYDDLVEERNVNGLCGYTLCARPKPAPSRGGEWKLVNVGRSDFDIVNRRESEKWCSRDCQRRALYVKVQLNETAAWERMGILDIEIELLGEAGDSSTGAGGRDEDSAAAKAARDLANLRLEEGRRAAGESVALALERGEVGQPAQGKQFKLAIRERLVSAPAEDGGVFTGGPDDAHVLVEGHRPGAGRAKAQSEFT